MEWFGILRYFYLLGAANALFFCVLIFSKPRRNLADKLLGFWLIILSLQLLFPFLYLADIEAYYRFAGYEISFYAIHPLLLYLYIRAMTRQFPAKAKLIPILLVVGLTEICVLTFFILPAKDRLNLILGNEPISFIYYLVFIPVIIYYTSFFVFSLHALKNYKSNVLQVYSYKENVDLLWLSRLVFLFYGLLVLFTPLAVIFYLNQISVAESDYFYFAGLTFFIFFLGYWGYKQGEVFNLQAGTESDTINHEIDQIKTFIPKNVKGKAQELKQLMERRQPYLNPTITIFELAKLINMQPHQLSKLINKEFSCNFFEYINSYRIESFKKCMLENKFKDFTLLGVAFECGFNSKSAFNRIFKEQTGLTPGEFKKQHQPSNVLIN